MVKKSKKAKVVKVPAKAKGALAIPQKDKTAYGKKADKEEAKTIQKTALKRNWAIVTDNCYGVAYMKAYNKPYESPFFSMYILAPDYILLLKHFTRFMLSKPRIQKPEGKTRYYKGRERKYPVLLLKTKWGEVEIHFAHEKGGAKEALKKWESRKSRMGATYTDAEKAKDVAEGKKGYNNMFVKMDDRDQFTAKLGKEFLAMDKFPNKVLFVSQKWKKEFEGMDNVVITPYKSSGPIGTKLEKEYPIPARSNILI